MAMCGDVQRLASALLRPRAGYVARIERTRTAVAVRSVDAARQLEMFIGRIADLTIEELREVYDETFRPGGPNGIGPAVLRLARASADAEDAVAAVDALAPMLERLEADRNPFAYVVKALCCVLLADGRRPVADTRLMQGRRKPTPGTIPPSNGLEDP